MLLRCLKFIRTCSTPLLMRPATTPLPLMGAEVKPLGLTRFLFSQNADPWDPVPHLPSNSIRQHHEGQFKNKAISQPNKWARVINLNSPTKAIPQPRPFPNQDHSPAKASPQPNKWAWVINLTSMIGEAKIHQGILQIVRNESE